MRGVVEDRSAVFCIEAHAFLAQCSGYWVIPSEINQALNFTVINLNQTQNFDSISTKSDFKFFLVFIMCRYQIFYADRNNVEVLITWTLIKIERWIRSQFEALGLGFNIIHNIVG